MEMKELREMNDAELMTKENELREDIFRLKFKLANGELEDTSQIGDAKKTIARIKTIITERTAQA